MGLRDKARESASKDTDKQAETPEPTPPSEPAPAQAELSQEKSEGKPSDELEQSVTYLVEEERPELAYALFKKAAAQGMRGMIVSRTYPKNLRKSLDLGDVPVYWLTNAMSDEAIGPKDLERLTLTIRRFMEEGGGQVVLIDSLEYIITNNKFVSVLRLIQTIRDLVAVHKAVGIVSIKSSTLEPSKLASIQRELEVYSADKSVSAPSVPRPPAESPVIAELKQDELMLEAERLEQQKKTVAAAADKGAKAAQRLSLERQELE